MASESEIRKGRWTLATAGGTKRVKREMAEDGIGVKVCHAGSIYIGFDEMYQRYVGGRWVVVGGEGRGRGRGF